MTAAPRPVTQVAVGVLVRDDGAVLLADRPAGKPYAGYWEFPGGKIEHGETVAQALARELAEELGVTVRESLPWVTMEYDYPHAYVRLHFRRIHDWSGAPRSVEGQQLRFLAPGDAPPAPLLPAAVPAMRWIQLPTVTGLSPGTATTAAAALAWMENVMDRGLRQVIWHEPQLDTAGRAAALDACGRCAHAYGARLLVDGRCAQDPPPGAASAGSPLGRFLDLAALRSAGRRPDVPWLGAAAETPADLARAAALGCDFALVDGTGASPDTPRWTSLAALCDQAPLPIYLTGEPDIAALRAAQNIGVHGQAIRIADAPAASVIRS